MLGRRRIDDVSNGLAWLRDRPETAGEAQVVSIVTQRRAQLAASDKTVGDATEALGHSHQVSIAEESMGASAPGDKALLLMRLAAAWAPGRVVELGSAFGVSGAYFAAGLQSNGGGELVSIEAVAARSRLAQETIALVPTPDVDVRLVVGLFDEHLTEFAGARLVYLDGNHYAAPTRAYVEAAVASLAPDGVIVLDDIDGYSAEMDRLWNELRRDRRFRVTGRCRDLGLLAMSAAASHRLSPGSAMRP